MPRDPRHRRTLLPLALLGAALMAAGLSACRSVPDAEGETAQPMVAQLTIDGVQAVDEGDLRRSLQTRERPWLPWRQAQPFDPEAFEADLRQIPQFYAARGYPDARVVESTITRDNADRSVRVRIVIEEGEPVRVAQVDYVEFDVLSPARLAAMQQAALLEPGDPLDQAAREATGQVALRALQDAGYAFAQVTVGDVRQPAGEVRVVLRAEPGDPAIFGPVDISGHVSVTDAVIRRYVAYLPGERFQVTAVEETRRRLLGLGLFTDVRIEAVPTDRPAPVRTRVIVEEGDHRRFDFSVGYASEAHAHADVQLSHVNVFGGARTATIHGRLSWLDRGLQGIFVQPYLVTPDISLRVDGHLWFTDQRRYEVLSRGARATVQYQRGPRLTTHATFLNEFTTTQLSDDAMAEAALVPLTAPAIDPFTGRQRGLLSAVELGATWNGTEGGAEPERGYVLSGRIEQAGGWLPGRFHYVGLLGEARGYLPVPGAMTVAQRVRVGSISPFGPPGDVPFFRRYFLGGADSLRGWGRFEVGPLSPGGVPFGGHALLESATELRLPPVAGLRGVVFLDAGNVWPQADTLRLGDLRYAIGAGLRYASPFGPLRLDAGYQLNPIEGLRIDGSPQERRWRIHVSVLPPF